MSLTILQAAARHSLALDNWNEARWELEENPSSLPEHHEVLVLASRKAHLELSDAYEVLMSAGEWPGILSAVSDAKDEMHSLRDAGLPLWDIASGKTEVPKRTEAQMMDSFFSSWSSREQASR